MLLASIDGVVTPIRTNPKGKTVEGYYWDISLDLSDHQCIDDSAVVHHCDGCGRSFTTGGNSQPSCANRAVTVKLYTTNKPGNLVCDTDLDGDGRVECDMRTGSLKALTGGGEPRWVPLNFWQFPTDGSAPVCLARATNGIKEQQCRPVSSGSESGNSDNSGESGSGGGGGGRGRN